MLPFLILFMGSSTILLFKIIIIGYETPSQDPLPDQNPFQKFMWKALGMILSIGK